MDEREQERERELEKKRRTDSYAGENARPDSGTTGKEG